MMQPRAPPAAADEAALQAVWIVRLPPARPADAEPATRRTPQRAPGPRPSVTRPTEPTPPPLREAAGTDGARPMSAVYLLQARRNATDAVVPAPRDPFEDRHSRLPGEGSARFRMKSPTSVAGVVSAVGGMFGARDPDEPCREHRRNIGAMALDGDSAALQHQLEYERRFCRP